MEAYLEDVHNFEVDQATQRVLKPAFKEYVIHQLEFLARMYQIDNAVSKMGLSLLKIVQTPTPEQQREAHGHMLATTIDSKDQIYHIVSLEWYTRWVDFIEGRSQLPPGTINNPSQLQNLCVDTTGPKPQFLPFCDDFMNNLQIRDDVCEGKDYKILSDMMFTYIYQIYGGTDIRRLSIKLKTDPSVKRLISGTTDGISEISGLELIDSKKCEIPETLHEVEVNLRRIKIVLTPNQAMFPTFPKGENPFTVYISSTATIGVLHHKILLGLINQSGSN
jgi:hypothetical protein